MHYRIYQRLLLISILAAASTLFFCSCSQKRELTRQERLVDIQDSSDLQEYIRYTDRDTNTIEYYSPIWSYLTRNSDYKGIIDVTLPFYERSKRDSYEDGIIYSAAYLAQIYLHYGNPDSLRIYLDEIMKHDIFEPRLKALINSIEGTYALRYELDYTRSMRCFMESYRMLKEIGSSERIVTNLCNITFIYALRNDPLGYKYAKEALDLCHQEKLDHHFESISQLSIAEMLLLNKDYNGALQHVSTVEKIIEENKLDYLKAQAYVLHAKLFKILGSRYDAEAYFDKAKRYLEKGQIGESIEFYFNKGELYRKFMDSELALKNYYKALEISYNYKHKEYRGQTLLGISDVYEKMNQQDRSNTYLRHFNLFKDSVLNAQKERDFNNYQLLLQKSEHEKVLQEKEIDLLKANRKTLIILSVLIIFAIIVTFVLISIINKNRNYAKLVRIHQKNLYKSNPELISQKIKVMDDNDYDTSEDKEGNDDLSKEIYNRIEEMMKTDKIYKDKELTLEKVAGLLNSNRSYVSRAINKYSGLGFFNYINNYRINEATKILSESDIPLKQLCEDVGFVSISTFYRAFQKETGCSPSRYRTELIKLKKSGK